MNIECLSNHGRVTMEATASQYQASRAPKSIVPQRCRLVKYWSFEVSQPIRLGWVFELGIALHSCACSW